MKTNNKQARANLVKALDLIARSVNDEDVLEIWLTYGVADGDIDNNTTADEIEYYLDNKTLKELMTVFRKVIKKSELYFDGVVSD